MPIRALLDTHVFVWFIAGEERLSRAARELLQDRENEILISMRACGRSRSSTAWESSTWSACLPS
jgi:predicted nucleic acid-binding protein